MDTLPRLQFTDLLDHLSIQITVIFLKDEEPHSLPLIIGSSIGGLLVLVVIIAILYKVSSTHHVWKKRKARGAHVGFSTFEDS